MGNINTNTSFFSRLCAIPVIVQIKPTLSSLKKHPFLLLISMILDLAFFISFAYTITRTFLSLRQTLETVYTVLGKTLSASESALSQSASSLPLESYSAVASQQSTILGLYSDIVFTVFTGAIATFFLWTILQGVLWIISHHIVHKEIDIKQISMRFIAASIIFFAMLFFIFLFSVWLSTISFNSLLLLFSQNSINTITLVLFFLAVYFTGVFYATAHLPTTFFQWMRKSFISAVNKPQRSVIAFVLVCAIILGLNALMMRVFEIHWTAFVVFGLLVVLPSYTFCRVYWIGVISTITENTKFNQYTLGQRKARKLDNRVTYKKNKKI